MHAVIALACPEFERRFERSLPPEHRIRARRVCADDRFVEFIVEGPMLPLVEEGEFRRADMVLSTHHDAETGEVVLEASWHFLFGNRPGFTNHSGPWQIGHWENYEAMLAEWESTG